jgi:hypothetical protein
MKSRFSVCAGAAAVIAVTGILISGVQLPSVAPVLAAAEAGAGKALSGLALQSPLAVQSCNTVSLSVPRVETSGPQVISGWLFNFLYQVFGFGCGKPN